MVADAKSAVRRLRASLRRPVGVFLLVLALCWVIVLIGALLGGPKITRRAGPVLDLTPYGRPGVTLRLLYPETLSPSGQAALLTVIARAETPTASRPLRLALDSADDGIGFLDPDGWPVAGRLTLIPGYPEAAPYALRLAGTGSDLRGGWLTARRVPFRAYLLESSGAVPLVELGFQVAIPARVPSALRDLAADAAALWGPLLVVTLVVLAGWGAHRYQSRGRAEAEARQAREADSAAALWHRLQDELGAGRLQDARRSMEALRAIAPGYRGLALIDARLAEQELAALEREAATRRGLEAYARQDWRSAAAALATVEDGNTSPHDLAYYRRTAVLYADLTSRDRSRRVAAARALGEVGDLEVWGPLIAALGDSAEVVADAAEQALLRAGPACYGDLMAALRSGSPAVAGRAARVIRGYGQAMRDPLLEALRMPDATITPQVAGLLADLGGRRDLADALLWAPDTHLPSLAHALAGEGAAAAAPLIEVLAKAPPDRLGVVLAAIGAVKARADISRLLEDALRATRDQDGRERLERAIAVPAAPYSGPVSVPRPSDAAPGSSTPAEGRPAPEMESVAEPRPANASVAMDAAVAGGTEGGGAPPASPEQPQRGRRLRLFER